MGEPSSALAKNVSGKTYRFEANDQKVRSIKIEFSAQDARVTLGTELGEHVLEVGFGNWKELHDEFLCQLLRPG